jgi:hypothetical protein
MLDVIISSVILGFTTIGYGIFSLFKRNKNKNEKYRDDVTEYTIKRGESIKTQYKENEDEIIVSRRIPEDNPIYNDMKELNEKIKLEFPLDDKPLYRRHNKEVENEYYEIV